MFEQIIIIITLHHHHNYLKYIFNWFFSHLIFFSREGKAYW
uniref:Uncharacterized protein n=1 Tax=Anguilla anguilla TaxID=7936 RepID=A0A0E9VHS9_ANGAN